MARVLITCLGRPFVGTTRKDYKRTAYRFPDGSVSREVAISCEAIWGHSPLDRIVVLGTPGSCWDALWFAVHPAVDGTPIEALIAAVDSKATTEAHLAPLAEAVREHTGIEPRLGLVPNGECREEQHEILDVMQRHVDSGDTVILDVTHGFRHLPMLTIASALLLQRARDAKIEEIYYAALDMREGRPAAPMVPLGWLLELASFTERVGRFRTRGELGAIAADVPDDLLRNQLEDAAFHLVTGQLDHVGRLASAAYARLPSVRSAFIDLVRRDLDRQLRILSRVADQTESLVELARAAFANGDWLRAVTFLFEARSAFQGYPDARDDQTLTALLRHAMAHAGAVEDEAGDDRRRRDQKQRARKTLGSRIRFGAALERLFARLSSGRST